MILFIDGKPTTAQSYAVSRNLDTCAEVHLTGVPYSFVMDGPGKDYWMELRRQLDLPPHLGWLYRLLRRERWWIEPLGMFRVVHVQYTWGHQVEVDLKDAAWLEMDSRIWSEDV